MSASLHCPLYVRRSADDGTCLQDMHHACKQARSEQYRTVILSGKESWSRADYAHTFPLLL